MKIATVCSWMFQVTFEFRSIKMKKVYQQYHINPSDHLFLLCSLHWNDADEKYSLEHAAHHHQLWSQQCLCSSGVQNMCQRVSTAARHFFDQALLHDLRDFTWFLRDFTWFFARHKFSAARHLKLFCTPAGGTFWGCQWRKILYMFCFYKLCTISVQNKRW